MSIQKLLVFGGLLVVLTACVPEYDDPNPPRAIKGGTVAKVVVEEFGDFQCPACGQAYPVLKALAEQYGNRVQWKYYHFPLISIHPFAFNAALAAECANDQGKFWEYHDTLFENQQKLGKGDLNTYAGEVGLDTELFKACLNSRAKTETVRGDLAFGDSRGVQSTPTIFLDGERLHNYSSLESRLQTLFAEEENSDEESEEDTE